MIDYADIERRINNLEQRLTDVVRNGVISEADYPKKVVRVKYGDNAFTGWLPWMTRRAGNAVEWWAPVVGEQVTVLSPGGVMTQGIVLPALYSTAHPAPLTDPAIHRINYGDGSFTEYNESTHTMTVTVNGGDVKLNATGNLDAAVGGDVDITADGANNVTVNGVNLDGAGGGGVKGVVQGDCTCIFSGAPHAQISSTVKASK